MTSSCVVLITTPPGAVGKRIARKIVGGRYAACVNRISLVESTYWWKGKIEVGKEDLLVVKTTKAKVGRLISFVKSIHPYSVPEVIALPIVNGHKPYLQWLQAEIKR